MRGSAVATIVWSSAASSVASMIPLNATRIVRWEGRDPVAVTASTLEHAHDLDYRLRAPAPARARRRAGGRGDRAPDRRALPSAVAPAGHVQDPARGASGRARDRLRAPALARHARRPALAVQAQPR